MSDISKFGIECIIARIFSHLQSDNMDSRTSSKSNLSESSSWDYDTMCQNTAKLDEMMLSMKQGESVPCNACNKRKDTLARREEIAWQREEIIHTREKELREWELMLEEKSKVLIEKEKKIYDEGKVLHIESLHNLEKNSRKSSLSDIGHGTVTLELHTKEDVKNEFVLEREKLLQEKEKIISEKMENIVQKEKIIALKEEQLSKQKIIFIKETGLLTQKIHNLDLREQVVKRIEEAVEKKLNSVCEKIKSLDERNILLTEKENALSTATEYIQNKEQSLNERESTIIEKERNFILQVSNLAKHARTESPAEDGKELFNELNELFEEKWKPIQERENTLVNSEQILLQKWKEYSEAKQLLKSEEESLQADRGSFEKEKNVLREWEKLLKKGEKEVEENHELITGNININRSFLDNESVKIWSSSLDIHANKDVKSNRSSPFGAVGQLLNGDINLKLPDADANFSKKIPISENREISGDELFRYYEKEKESIHALLLKENTDISTNTGESRYSEKNQELTEPVQAFFNKKVNAMSSLGENAQQNVVCVPEVNSQTSEISSDVSGERNNKDSLQEDILNYDVAFHSQNESPVYSENQCIPDSSSMSYERSRLLSMINKESDKKSNVVISGAEIDISGKVTDKNDNRPSEMHEVVGKDDSPAQKNTKSQNPQEAGSVLKETNGASPMNEKVKVENESHVKDGSNLEISRTRLSPVPSRSSSRSLTSPISGRGTPWLEKNRRKPPKDALLQAISKRNFLETVQLLDTNCMSLEVRNEEGRSAALLAVECGNIELLDRLMSKGAEIKACDYKGYSALHIAVMENNPEMVLFLLKKGVNPLVTDINGNTAVELASMLKLSALSDIMNKYHTTKPT